LSPDGEKVRMRRLTGDSLSARNTLESPGEVGMEEWEESVGSELTLPAASLTVLEFPLQ
jgi:hypothetical protein